MLTLAFAAATVSPASADELLGADSACLHAPDLTAGRALPAPAQPTGLKANGGAPAAPPPPLSTLRLVWMDPAHVMGFGASGARDEVVRIFKAMGIATRWRQAKAQDTVVAGELEVVLLGRCEPANPRAVVLGATPTHNEGTPLVWIHVPCVRGALGLGEREPLTLETRDTYRLGVAVGRVIAHEVVHALAPAQPHGDGLMAHHLTLTDLTAPSLPVAPGVRAAVRGALAGEAAPPVQTGLLTAEHLRRDDRPEDGR